MDTTTPEFLRRCSNGGRAAAARLTPEQRREKARAGARALHATVDPEVRRAWGRKGALALAAKRAQARCTAGCGGTAFARGLCMGCFLARWSPPRAVIGGLL